MKAVILRIMKLLEITDQDTKISQMFDKLIQIQNLQSQACAKAITQFLKNPKKKIDEDDLLNPIKTYSTTFEFLRNDIE